MISVSKIFEILPGHGLELCNMSISQQGIPFVNRSSKNNGVACRIDPIDDLLPLPAHTLSVALNGSVLETFLQTEPYYTAYHVACLKPLIELSDQELLYYAACIRLNQYKYNYGRQANASLKFLEIPSPKDIPAWVKSYSIPSMKTYLNRASKDDVPFNPIKWKKFGLEQLFDFDKGTFHPEGTYTTGNTPLIAAGEKNNGIMRMTNLPAVFPANTITVGKAQLTVFYQPKPFAASHDAVVLFPKFKCNKYIGLFMCAVIKNVAYRFHYGRQIQLEATKKLQIKLPVILKDNVPITDDDGNCIPDFEYMESFMKSLPFSNKI